MWIDPYSVDHRRAAGAWLPIRLRRLARGLLDPLVDPLESSVQTAFVVGCGHSGTTLLVAKLGRLKACFVPGWETGIFHPDQGLYWSKAAFITLLRAAESTGKQPLLEKTPKHVHCAKRIRRLLPRAKFLVMTRNPVDTCASLYERFGDLDFSIERWNLDNSAALSVLRSSSALRVRYEDLTAEPARVFSEAASFVGLDWDIDAVAPGETAFSSVGQDGNMALRAAQVARGVEKRDEAWRGRLGPAQVEKVRRGTAAIAKDLGYDFIDASRA